MSPFSKLIAVASLALSLITTGCQTSPDAAMAKAEKAQAKAEGQVAKLDYQIQKADTPTPTPTSTDPTQAGADALAMNEEDDGPEITPDGFTATLEVESMTLTGAMEPASLPEANAKGVLVKGTDGKAVGTIKLEPGIYRAQLYMTRGADELHDAVNLIINKKAPFRVYRADAPLGPVEELTPRFKLTEPTTIPVEIHAAESGMTLDRIVFIRQKLVR